MERITRQKVAGMSLAVCGVAILNVFPPPNGPQPSALGDLFTFLAGLTFALFTVVGKRATQRHNPVTVTSFAYVGGALALAPLTLWQGTRFAFERVTPSAWAGLVYMAVFPSVVCYLIYYYALSHISASRVASLSYLQPLIATGLAIALLDELARKQHHVASARAKRRKKDRDDAQAEHQIGAKPSRLDFGA